MIKKPLINWKKKKLISIEPRPNGATGPCWRLSDDNRPWQSILCKREIEDRGIEEVKSRMYNSYDVPEDEIPSELEGYIWMMWDQRRNKAWGRLAYHPEVTLKEIEENTKSV